MHTGARGRILAIVHPWGPKWALDVNWPARLRVWTSAVRGCGGPLYGGMPCRRPMGRTRGADGTSIITGCRSPGSGADHQSAGLRPRAHPGPATGGAHHPRCGKGKRHPGQHGRGLLRRPPPSARPPARTPAQHPGRVPDHRARAGSPLAGRAEQGPACAGPPSGRPGPLPGPGQLPAGGCCLVLRPRGVSPAPGPAGDRAGLTGASRTECRGGLRPTRCRRGGRATARSASRRSSPLGHHIHKTPPDRGVESRARQVRQISASARSSLVPVPVHSARTRSAAPFRNPVVTSRSASPSSRSVPSSMSLPGTSTSPSV